MRKTNYAAFAISILMTGALLGGCGATGAPASSSQAGNQTSASFSSSTAPVTLVAAAESDLFTSRDLEQRADLSQAKEISVSSGGSVSIKEAGVYILSGTAENASIVVEAGDEDKVQLVLKGLKITNAHQACILVENADKVFITSAEGSDNSLTVSGKFTDSITINGTSISAKSLAKEGFKIRSFFSRFPWLFPFLQSIIIWLMAYIASASLCMSGYTIIPIGYMTPVQKPGPSLGLALSVRAGAGGSAAGT